VEGLFNLAGSGIHHGAGAGSPNTVMHADDRYFSFSRPEDLVLSALGQNVPTDNKPIDVSGDPRFAVGNLSECNRLQSPVVPKMGKRQDRT